MKFEFFDNSARSKVSKAQQLITPKYPWKEVPTGKSFAVPRENAKLKNLRSLASVMGKKLGKKFRVVDHGEDAPYEVACLQMTESEAAASSGGIIEALNKLKKEGE